MLTTCDNNGCRGGPCAVQVRVKNGVITAIENGDPMNQKMPVEDLYVGEDALRKYMIQSRPCVRAYMWPKTVYHRDRLLYPMKRVGNMGDRKFVRISWTEALDTIANQLKSLKDKYGPYIVNTPPRVGSYANFGYSHWGYTSNSSHTLCDLVMFGEIGAYKGAAGAFTNVVDCFNTKAFVAFGWNPAISNYGGLSSQWTYLLKYFREKGVPIIMIDCHYSLSCETLADQWIPIRAGTDLAMLLAMANVLFKENLYDQAFVSKYVEPTGFAKWKDYVLGNTAGPDGKIDRTPEWAEKICGVPAETIRDLTRFCAKTKPLFWMCYWSVGKKFSGEMTGWADEGVKLMLGAFGMPGNNGSGVREVNYGPVRYLTPPAPNWKRAAATWTAPQLHYSRQKSNSFELYPKLVKGEITEDRYRREIGCAKDWPLPRPVFHWMGSSHGDMNTNQSWRALKLAQFVVSRAYHSTYPNCFYADIILPLADNHFEDYVGFTGAVNMFMLARKSIEPPGEAKTSSWIDMQLEKRFGVLDKSEPRLAAIVDDQKKIDQETESALKEAYDTWVVRDDVKSLKPPTWDQFAKVPLFRVPHIGLSYNSLDKPPFNAYAPFMADPVKNPMDTPSGKIEIYSDFIADPEMATKGYIKPKSKFNCEICFGGASPPVIPPMPEFVLEWSHPLSKYAEQYPLTVISLHSNYLQHHSQDNNPYRRELGRHACWLSVADAKARGIKDGDLVRVQGELGEIIIPAYVSSRVVPGTSNVGYGGWYEPSSLKTPLMPDGVDLRGMHNFLTPSSNYPWATGVGVVMHNCQVSKFDTMPSA